MATTSTSTPILMPIFNINGQDGGGGGLVININDCLHEYGLEGVFDQLPIRELVHVDRVCALWASIKPFACRRRRTLTLLIGTGAEDQLANSYTWAPLQDELTPSNGSAAAAAADLIPLARMSELGPRALARATGLELPISDSADWLPIEFPNIEHLYVVHAGVDVTPALAQLTRLLTSALWSPRLISLHLSCAYRELAPPTPGWSANRAEIAAEFRGLVRLLNDAHRTLPRLRALTLEIHNVFACQDELRLSGGARGGGGGGGGLAMAPSLLARLEQFRLQAAWPADDIIWRALAPAIIAGHAPRDIRLHCRLFPRHLRSLLERRPDGAHFTGLHLYLDSGNGDGGGGAELELKDLALVGGAFPRLHALRLDNISTPLPSLVKSLAGLAQLRQLELNYGARLASRAAAAEVADTPPSNHGGGGGGHAQLRSVLSLRINCRTLLLLQRDDAHQQFLSHAFPRLEMLYCCNLGCHFCALTGGGGGAGGGSGQCEIERILLIGKHCPRMRIIQTLGVANADGRQAQQAHAHHHQQQQPKLITWKRDPITGEFNSSSSSSSAH